MRQIQQLVFDGKRVFCPRHPHNVLKEAWMSGMDGPFSLICMAAIEWGMPCNNSAEWPTRVDMLRELGPAAAEGDKTGTK